MVSLAGCPGLVRLMSYRWATGLCLLSLWFFACSQPGNDLPDFSVGPEQTMASHGEDVVIQLESSFPAQQETVEWFLDGVATGIKGSQYTLSPSSVDEHRHLVYAEVDERKSNTVEVYFTSHPKLIESVYHFIDKYEIKAAISVSVYNQNTDFFLNEGLTSLSGGSENSKNTLHYIYSISKTLVAAIALAQVEANVISLDSKLSDILPNLSSSFLNEDATLEELLSHRSGIYDYVDNPLLFTQNPYRKQVWDPALLFSFIRSPAGDRGYYSYSTTNFILIGMMLEKAVGKALNTLLIETFLTPLNLDNLYLLPQDTVDGSLVSHPHVHPNTALSLAGDGKTPIDITTIFPDAIELLGKSSWAGGGMVGTAEETAYWGYHLYSSNSTVLDVTVKTRIIESVAGFEKSDADYSYGYGVKKLFYKDTYFLGSYGRSTGSENLMFYSPDTDTCFVVLTSSNADTMGNPNIDEILFDLYDTLAGDD